MRREKQHGLLHVKMLTMSGSLLGKNLSFLKDEQRVLRVFLLLSSRQEILLQLLTVRMHSPLLWRGFASLTLWETSLKLTQFTAREFHADWHPWDSPVSGILSCYGMVLPLQKHS